MEDGVIRVSTDPAYPPQSSYNEETGEYEGFDIDVATEIATRLGVEIQWETPSWELITAGGWNDRWDMSVGSMTVTAERAEVLDFSPAYYYTPASVAVHVDNTSVQDLATDLDGATIGVCAGCTYDFFLQKTLNIPGYTFDFVIDDAEIVGYDTDSTAIQDLSLGDGLRLDAAISALLTLEKAVEKGKPIRSSAIRSTSHSASRSTERDPIRQPGGGGQPDHRRDARGWDAHRALDEVVRH
jgi:polar amino acid transport system substrate-binding protein